MKTVFFAVFVSAFMSVSAQTEINWQRDLKLSWDDFKGEPDNANPFAALTRSGFRYKYKFNGDSLNLETASNFKPELSWVKKRSEHLLAHEQLHFDITEYHRRLFLARVLKAAIDPVNAKQTLMQIQNETIAEMRSEQMKYDEETNHSINKEAQEKWRQKYLKLLIETFERTDLMIRFKK